MSKVKDNWLLAVFKKLVEEGENENIEEIKAPKESAFLSQLKKQTLESINSENDTSNKKAGKIGGLKKKYETPAIEVEEMSQEKLEEMKKKLEKQRESNSGEKEISE